MISHIQQALQECTSQTRRDDIREKTARPDLSTVYDGIPLDPLNNYALKKPRPPQEEFGIRVAVLCEELLFKMNIADQQHVFNPEPFFASLAVYDLRENERVSESFMFDLNRPFEDPPNEQKERPDIATKAHEAIFNVLTTHPEVYLVLTVEKVLQGDIGSATDAYAKGADKQKAALKQREAATTARDRLGQHRMPFAWAARPLFKASGALESDPHKEFSDLFKQDANKLRDEDILKMVADYHAYLVQKESGMKKAKLNLSLVPGHFKARVIPFAQREAMIEDTLTHSFIPLNSTKRTSRKNRISLPAREVLSFPLASQTMLMPHAEYADYIYVYPQSIDFSLKKAASVSKTSARNIAWRVQLVHSDGGALMKLPEGMPCIFGKSSGPKFCSSATTSVSYHSKTPQFYEEVKIKLPAALDENHHLLFTFFHIEVNENKKNKAGIEAPIGYAWLPLCRPRTTVLDHEIFCDHKLLVAGANIKYTGNAILPGSYYQARNSPGGQTKGPNIKWLDSNKPLVQLKVRQFSSVRSSDPYIINFFQIESSKTAPGILLDSIDRLRQASLSALFVHMPVIFNKLFSLLVEIKDPIVEGNVSIKVVSIILHIVSQYCEKREAGAHTFLSSYVYYVFDHPIPPGGRRASINEPTATVHHKLLKYLANLMTVESRSDATGKELRESDQERFLCYSWFFYLVIFKSMGQVAAAQPKEASRKGRFSQELVQSLKNLVVNIARSLMTRIKAHISICYSANDNLAYFLQSCFGIMDRGAVFSVLQQYLRAIQAEDLNFRIFKMNFIRIICEYEHLVPLSLPVVTGGEIIVEPMDKNGDFEERHVLPGILLRALQQTLIHDPQLDPNGTVGLRQKCIATICGLFRKHDSDKRYNGSKEKLACITSMYFPLVNIIMSNYFRLHGVKLSRKQQDKDREILGPQETRELLFCFMWILRYAHSDHLRQWWKSDFCRLERLLDLLNLCVEEFRYQGSKQLTNQRPNASSSAEASKRALEQLYSPSSSAMATGRRPSTAGGGPLRRKRSNSIPVDPRDSAESDMSDGVSSGKLKDTVRRSNKYNSYSADSMGAASDIEQRIAMQSHLSTELSITILGLMDQFFVDHKAEIDDLVGGNKLTYKMFKLMTDIYSKGLSVRAVPVWMNTMHAFMSSFTHVLFQCTADYCQSLCSLLLRACNSVRTPVRDHACTLLYVLLRINQPRVSLDVTVALSKLDRRILKGSACAVAVF